MRPDAPNRERKWGWIGAAIMLLGLVPLLWGLLYLPDGTFQQQWKEAPGAVLAVYGGFAIMGVGLIVALIGVAQWEKREMEKAARRMGLRPVPAEEWGALPQVRVFLPGGSRVTRLLEGEVEGHRVLLCRCAFSGKHWRGYPVAIFEAGSWLPEFGMVPEVLADKVPALGRQDIDFETHPKFSGQYRLIGPDEASIRAVFTPAVLDFFEREKLPWMARWVVRSHGGWLGVYWQWPEPPWKDVPEFFERAKAVLRLLTVGRR